jgi:hypothetical protein
MARPHRRARLRFSHRLSWILVAAIGIGSFLFTKVVETTRGEQVGERDKKLVYARVRQ